MIWTHIANFLTALSIGGISVLGVIETSLTLQTLIVSAVIFGFMGVIGKYVDDTIEDGLEYDDDDKSVDNKQSNVDS